MKVIQTKYNGYLFRSRTEARWAVFFDSAGIKYEYEKEGFDLNGTWYLPDFYLPQFEAWVEIKGKFPTPEEIIKCQKLATETGDKVWLIIGAPEPRGQILVLKPSELNPSKEPKFYMLCDDRRNEGEFWMYGGNEDIQEGFSIGPVFGPDHGKAPLVHSRTAQAYEASKSARFEHGEAKVG